MKKEDRKPILESRKARWFYSIRAIAAMVVSLGGLFLAKIGHGGTQLVPDSMGAMSLYSLIGWAIGALGAIVAVVIARRSKGSFILTKEKVAFVGMTEKENWDIHRSLIRNCTFVDSWLDGVMGAAKILLALEDTAGNEASVMIGPFPKKTADAWMKDLKKEIEGAPEKKKKDKGQDMMDDGRLPDPMKTVVSQVV